MFMWVYWNIQLLIYLIELTTASVILKHLEAFWEEMSAESFHVEFSQLFNRGLSFVRNCLERVQKVK